MARNTILALAATFVLLTLGCLSAGFASASALPAPAPGAASTLSSASTTPDPDLSPTRRWVGLYVPGAPLSTSPLSTSEAKIGMPAAHFVNYFQYTVQDFTAQQAGNAVSHGSIPLITLEMWDPSEGVNQPTYSLRAIANGTWDAYLTKYAQDAKAFGHTVWLRPLHEMNGNWYPWCGTVNGNTPSDFVPAWRHIKAVFDAAGATNVKFVWCPNIESIDAAKSLTNPANAISAYWPGADYVDYIALDGYNFGTSHGLTWRSFTSLFKTPYNTVSSLSTSTPIFVAETACSTSGGDKAAWIADMFKVVPTSFPRIAGIGWFNANKDCDWRIDSSTGSLQSFSAGAFSSPWLPRRTSTLTIKSSVTYGRVGRAFLLSGALSPARYTNPVRVEVKKPGCSKWAFSSTRYGSVTGAWSYSYVPRVRGYYYFRVRFGGDSPRYPSLSRVIRVTVR